ncbi:MAG: hypothetical protein HYS18_14085 [Burkholderiales bacterium]|nr:hypothetical protein [Burkholderiales bacterium]
MRIGTIIHGAHYTVPLFAHAPQLPEKISAFYFEIARNTTLATLQNDRIVYLRKEWFPIRRNYWTK